MKWRMKMSGISTEIKPFSKFTCGEVCGEEILEVLPGKEKGRNGFASMGICIHRLAVVPCIDIPVHPDVDWCAWIVLVQAPECRDYIAEKTCANADRMKRGRHLQFAEQPVEFLEVGDFRLSLAGDDEKAIL